MTTRWPDFFIVGATKAGTTKLYGMLRAHPDIYMPARKEINYFNRDPRTPSHGDAAISESDYLSYFSKARPGMTIGDANAQYLHGARAVVRLANQCPCAAIIIILREPVSRAFSHYLMLQDRYELDLPEFGEMIRMELAMRREGVVPKRLNLVAAGEYGRLVPKWLKCFGSDRVGIFLFNDLVRDPGSFACRIADFIGVESDRFPARAFDADSYSYAVPRARVITKLAKNRFCHIGG